MAFLKQRILSTGYYSFKVIIRDLSIRPRWQITDNIAQINYYINVKKPFTFRPLMA
jgi:hypothetical protein